MTFRYERLSPTEGKASGTVTVEILRIREPLENRADSDLGRPALSVEHSTSFEIVEETSPNVTTTRSGSTVGTGINSMAEEAMDYEWEPPAFWFKFFMKLPGLSMGGNFRFDVLAVREPQSEEEPLRITVRISATGAAVAICEFMFRRGEGLLGMTLQRRNGERLTLSRIERK